MMVSDEVRKGEVYLYWIGRQETQGTEIKKIRPGVIISTDNLSELPPPLLGGGSSH